jgi:uncharacterized protein YkwD
VLEADLRRLMIAAALAIVCPTHGAAGAELAEAAKLVQQQTDEFRAAQGLEPVTTSRELAAAADAFAGFMAKNGNYGHTADGRQPVERAAAEGYDYCIVSENIARLHRSAGYDAPALARDMVEGWKNSPAHRRAMLDPAVTQTGVGIARDDQGRYFGVQMFGRPKTSAIRFSLRNQSTRKIEYRTGERRFSLPPRAERTHAVCRPLRITIELPKPFSAPASDGASYVVVERAGDPAVEVSGQ